MQISRRKVIGFLVAAPLAGSFLFLGRPFFSDSKKLSDIFGSEFYNLEIGKAARQQFFRNENLNKLVHDFELKMPGYYKIIPSYALRQAMRSDYWNGRTKIVKGWVLADSLVLLSVIAYLESPHVR